MTLKRIIYNKHSIKNKRHRVKKDTFFEIILHKLKRKVKKIHK